jgi:hypothetical protein
MKKRTYPWRLALILLAIVILVNLCSCSKDKDPSTEFIGTWAYSQSAAQPNIQASFNIISSGDKYAVSGITFNGATWPDYEIIDASSNTIKRIALYKKKNTLDANQIEVLVFVNCRISANHNTFMADTVLYQKVAEQHYFKNQTLSKVN